MPEPTTHPKRSRIPIALGLLITLSPWAVFLPWAVSRRDFSAWGAFTAITVLLVPPGLGVALLSARRPHRIAYLLLVIAAYGIGFAPPIYVLGVNGHDDAVGWLSFVTVPLALGVVCIATAALGIFEVIRAVTTKREGSPT